MHSTTIGVSGSSAPHEGLGALNHSYQCGLANGSSTAVGMSQKLGLALKSTFLAFCLGKGALSHVTAEEG